ncbi:MAG: DNA mismatch repair endonuclease MutL [Clostridia bacterium]|nr:DNA mismatch repair endonuclease MutL [Clostridia bacterium]
MAIRILDAATVGKISAGEVVERPSSVAKELIENSLDAGATSITVEIRDGGISYLRVTDNGCGIPFSEARMAFENHATSKLKNADGLFDIRTLGFRGEALPSIAAVSHVTMTTRTKDAEAGAKVEIEGGRFIGVSETGCPEGTTIVMRDLFFNVPVRRVFLKRPVYEQGLINELLQRMILGNPGVAFRLIANSRTIYRSYGDGDVRHAALAVYGRECAQALREVNASEGAFTVKGLIGVGDEAKPTRAQQCFFVNGRLIRCPLLSQALEEACRGRVTIGMYPMCALAVTMPPESVDINVHPSKLEVRFRDEAAFRLTAQSLFQKAFATETMMNSFSAPRAPEMPQTTVTRVTAAMDQRIDPAPAAQAEKHASVTLPQWQAPAASRFTNVSKPVGEVREGGFVPKPVSEVREGGFVPKPSVPAAGAVSESAIPAAKDVPAKEEAPVQNADVPAKPEKAEQLEMPETVVPKAQYRVIGTLFNTYILLEYGDNFLMIDQHAAHERLNFEKYRAMLDDGIAAQQLLAPYIIHVSRREADVLLSSKELLSEAGYEIDAFGASDIQVRAVPLVMGQSDMRMLFTELIDELDHLKTAEREKRMAGIIQASCKHAVKAGDRLTDLEIRSLLEQMTTSGAPPTCPHGRPVLRVMSKYEIERMFKRVQ